MQNTTIETIHVKKFEERFVQAKRVKECFKKKDREDLEKETRRMSTQDGQKHRLNQWSPNFRVENPCAMWSTDKAEQKLTKLYPL